MNDDDRPARLLAAVTRLQADYARYIDGGEPEAWSGLYGGGGVLSISDGREIGNADLPAFAARAPKGSHLQGVPSVEERSDGGVDAVSSFAFFNAETGAVVSGAYVDRMTWEEGRLVFARRHIDIRRSP
ncbi:nuclear transport factor 2 family protein [Spirillospora sp. NPDC047279]|uniref:nuclear transport factor 2 family protein n=1 Tax=Spirillospora sp. NPDC047279 TaxID=3155478 RepID=UPI0033E25DBB